MTVEHFFRTMVTSRDNRSIDIGRVLFALAIFSAIGLEVFVVTIRGTAFDLVAFCGGVSSLLVAGGASLAVKGSTEPSEITQVGATQVQIQEAKHDPQAPAA